MLTELVILCFSTLLKATPLLFESRLINSFCASILEAYLELSYLDVVSSWMMFDPMAREMLLGCYPPTPGVEAEAIDPEACCFAMSRFPSLLLPIKFKAYAKWGLVVILLGCILAEEEMVLLLMGEDMSSFLFT